MLLDVVLEGAEALVGEVLVKLVKAAVVADFDSLAAMAALEILHFAEDVLALGAELLDLLLRRLLELDKLSADVLLVELVELVLVLEEVGVVVVVHEGVELLADKAGNVGRALLLCEIVERENLVVIVTRAVLLGAVEHIKENLYAVFARTLVDGLDRLAHFS